MAIEGWQLFIDFPQNPPLIYRPYKTHPIHETSFPILGFKLWIRHSSFLKFQALLVLSVKVFSEKDKWFLAKFRFFLISECMRYFREKKFSHKMSIFFAFRSLEQNAKIFAFLEKFRFIIWMVNIFAIKKNKYK